ncbi:MAG: transposase [Chlamydiae bacterium]|nr:transposase [Chlamydiota bacterium]
MLGACSSLSQAEVHWREFFLHLHSHGMSGVRLIISDDHAGMKKGRIAFFPSIPWQRCPFYLAQNEESYEPKKNNEARNSPTFAVATLMKAQAIEKYQKRGG